MKKSDKPCYGYLYDIESVVCEDCPYIKECSELTKKLDEGIGKKGEQA